MKVHIKKVLNMNFENSTLDNYISSIFDLNNINPSYVFRLPDKNNRTLVFRKSDFSVAVFPNISNVNKFTKSSENLQTSSSSNKPVKIKNEELLEELRHENFIFENNLNSNIDDYDDNIEKIVDQNVNSEKDFIELMNSLNKDLNDEDLRENFQILAQVPKAKSMTQQLKNKKQIEKNEWDELGLTGWTGSVTGSKDKLPKREK